MPAWQHRLGPRSGLAPTHALQRLRDRASLVLDDHGYAEVGRVGLLLRRAGVVPRLLSLIIIKCLHADL